MDHRSISADQRGSILILAAFLIMPLVALAGGAVDLVRMTIFETRLQSAIDSAALSAASLTNEQDIDQVVDEFIAINLGNHQNQINDLDISTISNVTVNSKEVAIDAEGRISTFFLKVIGIDNLQIAASSTAGQSIQEIEVSLVLDISSSMEGGRLANLKAAAKAFVEKMLKTSVLDSTTINLIPFGGTVNVGALFDTYAVALEDAVVDPTEEQYMGTDIAEGDFRFSDSRHCIEYTEEDFNDDVLPVNARSQVPHFWRWFESNHWCPSNETASIFNTNNLDILTNAIDNFSLSDGTGTDIGMLWGVKALSPDWRGLLGGVKPDRPADYDDEKTLKVIVLMSDGGTTYQLRPEDPALNSVHTHGKNRKNERTTVSRNDARDNLKSLCKQAKADGVFVFSIGFQISASSYEEEDLQDCASSMGHYYLVETLDIDQAFQSIAVSIGALRLTQ